MGDNGNKGKFLKIVGLEGAGISSRNSTLDVEEDEGNKGEASESTDGKTGVGE